MMALAIKLTTPKRAGILSLACCRSERRPVHRLQIHDDGADADALKSDLLAQNEMSGPVFKMKDDPRITPRGPVLAQVQHQRTAAVVERAQGRHEPGWATPGVPA